jgi:hypothetical protein
LGGRAVDAERLVQVNNLIIRRAGCFDEKSLEAGVSVDDMAHADADGRYERFMPNRSTT